MDELSLVREPTKRSQSVAESITAISISNSHSMTTSMTQTSTNLSLVGARSSSGSLTSGGSTSSNSRPISLEDGLEQDDSATADTSKKPSTSSFWLFGRKSADQGYLKSTNQPAVAVETYGTLQRSPRHFSFEELNGVSSTKKHSTISSTMFHHHLQQLENNSSISTIRMHRDGSQGSLASSIFRKDFWKSNNPHQQQSTKQPLMSFHSDPSMISSMQRKGSFSSSLIHPSPSTSLTLLHQSSSMSNNGLQPENSDAFNHVLTSPHPLDNFSGSSKIEVASSPCSEVSTFNWE